MTRPTHRPIPVVDVSWMDRANCKGHDPSLFFSDKVGRIGVYTEAKAICSGCGVRGECLEYALEIRAHDGVYGGMTARQRRTLSRQRARDARRVVA